MVRLQVFGVHVTHCMLCVAFRWKTYFSVVNLIWIIFRLKEIVSKNVWAHQICSQLTSCLNLWKCSVITFLFDMLDLTQSEALKRSLFSFLNSSSLWQIFLYISKFIITEIALVINLKIFESIQVVGKSRCFIWVIEVISFLS